MDPFILGLSPGCPLRILTFAFLVTYKSSWLPLCMSSTQLKSWVNKHKGYPAPWLPDFFNLRLVQWRKHKLILVHRRLYHFAPFNIMRIELSSYHKDWDATEIFRIEKSWFMLKAEIWFWLWGQNVANRDKEIWSIIRKSISNCFFQCMEYSLGSIVRFASAEVS